MVNISKQCIVAMLLVPGAGAVCASAAQTAEIGAFVSTIKAFADGRELGHYKQEVSRYRADQDAKTRSDVGEWKTDTHTILLKRPGGATPETVWQRKTSYRAEEAARDLRGIEVRDVLLTDREVVVLFTDERAIVIDRWTRTADGSWRSGSYQVVPIGQVPSVGRIVISGKILQDEVAEITYKNGDAEKWSYAGKVPRVVWSNDLKVRYSVPESVYTE